MKKENFKNPGNRCRPMKLNHGYSFNSRMTREERNETIEKAIDRIKEIGYGGVTMNTPFGNYLEKKGFEDYGAALEKCIGSGMRTWIYDEKGYPSGGAGGLTLEGHPEYEAKGIVCKMVPVTFGQKITVRKPLYHDETITAYAFKTEKREKPLCKSLYSKETDLYVDGMTGGIVNLCKNISDKGNVTWVGGEGFYGAKEGDNYLLCCYYSKKLYENTHARQNFHEGRRYISVINKEAVGEFIKNTYAQYKKAAGKYFGKEIEAFFTDEPSLMAGYLDGTVTPPPDRIKDKPQDNFPLLPVLTWEPFLPDEFADRYGYSLLESLHYLYGGTGPAAVKVRYDFNSMIASLYEEAYFGQIEKFCRDANIDFSGHVLMEEYLLHHGIWEGNIFRIMSHMDIPGIDVLTTLPGEIVDMTVTPKLISSATCWFGKKHTMSEISAHSQMYFNKVPFGLKEMKGNVAAEFVLGIDNFQSYFSENVLPKDEYNEFCDYIARIGEALEGGRNGADIILYYPIEGVLSNVKGSDKFREVREYSESELKCADSWNNIAKSLVKNKLDYIMADEAAVKSLYVVEDEDEGALVNMISGNDYKAIVVPSLISTSEEFLAALADFAMNGITVIFDNLKVNLPSYKGNENLCESITELLSMENVINCTDPDDIARVLKTKFIPQAELEEEDEDIIYTKRTDTDMGCAEVYLLVNTGNKKCDNKVILNVEEDFEKIYGLVPETGAIKEIPFEFTEDGRVAVPVSFTEYSSVIIAVE